jgi:hypothetical protein
MRITQPSVANTIVAYSTTIWKAFCDWEKNLAPSPEAPEAVPTDRRAHLRSLLGGLPMEQADHWVVPLNDG